MQKNSIKNKIISYSTKLLLALLLLLIVLFLTTMFLDYRRKNIIEKRGTGVINDLREHPLLDTKP